MSISGNINKISGDISRAISAIASKGMLERDGSPLGTRKIVGYVIEIHEDGDLAGTIDVQEYGYDGHELGVGLHEGVLLSAVQDNEDGVYIIPQLYSEVVIVQNPIDRHEYVLMYSHAKRVQAKAREKVEICVEEVEDFVVQDDGIEKDYNELEPTKNKASTIYEADSIVDQIVSPDDEEGLRQEKTAEHKVITVGDTTITIDGQSVTIQTSGSVTFNVGGTAIEEKDGSVTIKTNDAKVDCSNCEVKGSDVKINGGTITLTGGTLKTRGASSTDLQGPYNAIKVCPFSGAPHCGSSVSGT